MIYCFIDIDLKYLDIYLHDFIMELMFIKGILIFMQIVENMAFI